MKTSYKPFLILLLMTLAAPMHTMAATPSTAPSAEMMKYLESTRLTNRLEEIKAMDKDGLTKMERKALRNEVKAIKKTNSNGGIYLSVGAVIIIILLLILLL